MIIDGIDKMLDKIKNLGIILMRAVIAIIRLGTVDLFLLVTIFCDINFSDVEPYILKIINYSSQVRRSYYVSTVLKYITLRPNNKGKFTSHN